MGDLPQEIVVRMMDIFSIAKILVSTTDDTVIQLNQITISEVVEDLEIRVFAQCSGLRVLSAEIEKVS